jgi:pyrroline-5-carboxylate reductase
LPRQNLIICHRGSGDTTKELESAGLDDLVADRERVVSSSRILLYLVRPQDRLAIADLTARRDSLFISFLAGIPLNSLPVPVPDTQRVRVMTSAPDTLLQRNGIAALYPAANVLARGMLEALGLRIISLGKESDMHAFTALGPCLPIVLTYWERAGHKTNDKELLRMGDDYGLSDYFPILQWAHSVKPRQLSPAEADRYLTQAATPGGVTDSILSAMRAGLDLSAALRKGIGRSQQLAAL